MSLQRAANKVMAGTVLAMLSLAFSSAILADIEDREQAKRLHDRLTGTPATTAVLDVMELSIANGNYEDAARYAIDGDMDTNPEPTNPNLGFYNQVLKNWAMPWTNRDFDVFPPLNDYVATVIGMVRDESDFRGLLYENLIYTGNVTPAYSTTSNAHYEALEASGNNLGDLTVLSPSTQTSVTGIDSEGAAGIFTTRAAAKSFFIDGTNRAMFRYTLVNHLCTDLEQLQDASRSSDRIRQDVSRSPGGDSTVFLNNCVTCHSGMDPMAQAFAYYQFEYTDDPETGRLIYTPGFVQGKYLHNEATFSPGYITPNDHWSNYWRLGPNSEKLGWMLPAANSGAIDLALNPEYSEGDGAASLGQELANTEAFASCQVTKAFEAMCLRKPTSTDQAQFDSIVANFKTSNYNMKQTFIETAAYCASSL